MLVLLESYETESIKIMLKNVRFTEKHRKMSSKCADRLANTASQIKLLLYQTASLAV